MPKIDSKYRPPLPFRSGHIATMYPTLLRKLPDLPWERERIETPDGDFLDIDWLRREQPRGSRRAVIICHGLEGDTRRSYMRGMARAVLARGWDAVPWNFRGCSGEPNRKIHTYHSGFTQDLETVVRHVLDRGYEELCLAGFSLGGNLVLKYLGERGAGLDPRIVKGFAASVPVDLAAGAERSARWDNRLYMEYFMRKLRRKVEAKAAMFPGQVDLTGYRSIRTFQEFDERYTAPFNGFDGAEHYWAESSSRQFLPDIRVPTLLLQAADDPLLPEACYPEPEADTNPHLYLEIPRHGGHVGFCDIGPTYYSERRAMEFFALEE